VLADVRYGIRVLLCTPGSTTVAVLTLALGIGANAAVFSVVDATLLKPLPFRNPAQLVEVLEIRREGTPEQSIVRGLNRARVADWRAQSQLFESVEAAKPARSMKVGATDTTIQVVQVSPGLFSLLDVTPMVGRGFSPSESNGDPRVLLISDGLWKRLLGGDLAGVGREIVLDGKSMTVIGVMPPGARFPLNGRADAWMPLSSVRDPKDPTWAYVDVIARLRGGLTLENALPEVRHAAASIQRARPEPERWSATLDPLDPREWLTGTQPVVLIAFGAVAFVLLTACANVANLLLARASGRRRDIAIRAALGATRWRVARQLLIESVLLAIAGGVAAVLLATWIIRALPGVLPPRLIAFSVYNAELDWRVLAFALAASMAVGVLSGVLPALRGSETRAQHSLAASATYGTPTPPHRRARTVLIAIQVALAVVLLTGAGLMTTSLLRLVSSESGFDADGLVALSAALPAEKYQDPAAQPAYLSALIESARAAPGVKAVTLGTPPPRESSGRFVAEGVERSGGAALLAAGPDYFAVLGIPLLAGRAFNADDRRGSMPVAIVDDKAAQLFWPGESPLGKRVRYSPYVEWMTVVGVARRVKTSDLGRASNRFQIYLPVSQAGFGEPTILARTVDNVAAASTLAAIRARVQRMDDKAAVSTAATVEALYDPALVNPRFSALMMSLFAGLGLLTAAVGLYGMLSYAVAQRTREIGVRMALGADRRAVRRLIVSDALWPVMLGLALGSISAQWLTRLIASQLYGVAPGDPLTFALVILLFAAVALIAASVPARHATRVDPVVALRAE
jgi:putative ABC transport system permease protein